TRDLQQDLPHVRLGIGRAGERREAFRAAPSDLGGVPVAKPDVRAALRYSRPGGQNGKLPDSRFQLHDLVIEYDTRTVYVAGNKVHLTQTEFNILALLAQHAGKLLTYTAMNETIWGASDLGGNKKLQVNMANLRRKLGVRPGDNRYIVNELGVGYRMQQVDEEKRL
ncbi:MAG: response regulator transcription factor, partial [Clostridia bacterium]|nr:response regulator transcription factor [Clostridia bacterium]